jgi:hypothetical protein
MSSTQSMLLPRRRRKMPFWRRRWEMLLDLVLIALAAVLLLELFLLLS